MGDKVLEEQYGPAADYSEHRCGDSITYRLAGSNAICSGTIIWITAARLAGSNEPGLRYIVVPDADANTTDVVFPGDVIEEKLPSN